MLSNLNFYDSDFNQPFTSTKWRRINESILKSDNKLNTLFKMIEYQMKPMNYIYNSDLWNNLKSSINSNLMFIGYELNDSGKVTYKAKVQSFSEAQKRMKSFKTKLEMYDIHNNVLKYCTEDYLNENYFYAIFEASKGVLDRVRKLSETTDDGNKLINKSFNNKNPLILIKNNFIRTQSEISEYYGLASLLKTIVYLYRNPKAHISKLFNPSSEADAITAFNLMSLAHKNLDKCISKRDAF